MMNRILLPLCVALVPMSASAGFRADDLAAHYLPDCAAPNRGTAPGPVNPRVAAPADAAPWLADRQWDVRPYAECSKVKKRVIIPQKKTPVKHKAPAPKAVPQK